MRQLGGLSSNLRKFRRPSFSPAEVLPHRRREAYYQTPRRMRSLWVVQAQTAEKSRVAITIDNGSICHLQASSWSDGISSCRWLRGPWRAVLRG